MPGAIYLAAQAGKASFNASVFTKAIRHLHSAGAYSPEMLADKPFLSLLKETNRVLQAAFDEGIADNTPSLAMLKKLREDVFLFSGCKTHKELKEAASWLLDDNGKVRSFTDFRNDVWKVHTAYNQHYLEAEYHFAIGSAQMAAKWDDFERDGDRYHLQYRTAGDDRVRPEHAELDLITLPASDRFWSRYYPPNGWRCRCTAVQVRAGKYPESDPGESERRGEAATTRIDKNGINADAIFRFNPGRDRQIFPPAHPYKKVQGSVRKIVEGLQVNASENVAGRKALFNRLSTDKSYTGVSFNEHTGGLKAIHTGHQFDPRTGVFERRVQNIAFDAGHSLILEDETGFAHRIADGIFNGRPAEIASITGTGKNAVKRALNHCRGKGAEVALLYFPDESSFSYKRLWEGVAKFSGQAAYEFANIYVITSGEIRLVK